MSIKLNIYLLYWYFQQNKCLNINKKHVVHNIHILAWATMVVGPPDKCLAFLCVKTALGLLPNISLIKTNYYNKNLQFLCHVIII